MNNSPIKIGLEIHVYLNTSHKLFCGCLIIPKALDNTNVCPVCMGYPGCKPITPDHQALQKTVRVVDFLNCDLNYEWKFQRKHYDYPDLPKGYQLTVSGPHLKESGYNGNYLGIRIKELHLEEDPAQFDPVTKSVNYNRSGYPLLEIVTEPDFINAEQAKEWVEFLILGLDYLGVLRKEMGIKCDVNVSIAPEYVRTEVKNINSPTEIYKAILHEVDRQAIEPLIQQTRGWDSVRCETYFMRKKENVDEYSFIPDPDLPIISIDNSYLSEATKDLYVEELKENLISPNWNPYPTKKDFTGLKKSLPRLPINLADIEIEAKKIMDNFMEELNASQQNTNR